MDNYLEWFAIFGAIVALFGLVLLGLAKYWQKKKAKEKP